MTLLSAEDIKILQLEKKKREIDAIYGPLPNCPARERLWQKSCKLMLQINTMIYDARGDYCKDKKHLLTGGALDISLLEEPTP